MSKKVTANSELLVLHINATTMVVQSRSDPSKGVIVEHDGHQPTRCLNAKCVEFKHNNCYHMSKCAEVLKEQEREQEEALNIAQNLFNPPERDWRIESSLNTGNKAFSLFR